MNVEDFVAQQLDLTKKPDVITLMTSTNTAKGWRRNRLLVVAANGGSYPPFWNEAIGPLPWPEGIAREAKPNE